jgi:prolyl-tRNA synthetase
MIMAHGDDKGLVLPPKVAPMQVVIVPIFRNDEGKDKVLPKVEEIRNELESKDIRVHVDEREGLSPGYKFNDWEMKGVPLRIEVGPKDIEKESIVVAKRYNLEKINLNFTELEKIPTKAKEEAVSNTIDISNYADFKSKIEKGGFFNSPWCGKTECEDKIKEETGAEIRVIPFGSEDTNQKCIYCQEQSVSIPIFARGY